MEPSPGEFGYHLAKRWLDYNVNTHVDLYRVKPASLPCEKCSQLHPDTVDLHHINIRRGPMAGVIQNSQHPLWCTYATEKVVKRIPLPGARDLQAADVVETSVWTNLEKQIEDTMLAEHPNIVSHYHAQLYFLGGYPHCAIFMEYCEDGNLADHVINLFNSWKPFPMSNYGRQILQGLTHIHRLGIIHKDIKPQNIFVKKENGGIRLKIGDFGDLTKMIGFMTQTNDITVCQGTRNFMSPEMMDVRAIDGSGVHTVGRLTDTFSFGCTLLSILRTDRDSRPPYYPALRYFREYSQQVPDKDGVLMERQVKQFYHAQGEDSKETWVPTAEKHVPLQLRQFIQNGGQIEVECSDDLAVVKTGDAIFAMRVPTGKRTRVNEWINQNGYEDGWVNHMEPVIRQCVQSLLLPSETLAGKRHDYDYSSRNPGPSVRPTAAQLLDEAVFKPLGVNDTELPAEKLIELYGTQ